MRRMSAGCDAGEQRPISTKLDVRDEIRERVEHTLDNLSGCARVEGTVEV
jgi:hypothetical protein